MERYPNWQQKNGLEIVQEAREAGHEVVVGNTELPIAEYASDIAESIKSNVFTIIISETGGGKTTQLPQIALV